MKSTKEDLIKEGEELIIETRKAREELKEAFNL